MYEKIALTSQSLYAAIEPESEIYAPILLSHEY